MLAKICYHKKAPPLHSKISSAGAGGKENFYQTAFHPRCGNRQGGTNHGSQADGRTGRTGRICPDIAELNDDVLFGQVWSREEQLSLRDRSLVTVTALMAQGLVDSSFQYHLITAKKNGITKTEIAEVITHAAFYAGWPKAWAAFSMAKEVWKDEE